LEAGSLADRSKRIAAGLDAGRRALDLATYADASSWVARVDELATEQVRAGLHAELELLRSDVERSIGDRRKATDAARAAAEYARVDGDPLLLARAAEAWERSLSGVGFEVGSRPDPELVALLSDAIAVLPPLERQYGVRLRSMLSSVLVGTTQWERRETLAREAMAMAEVDGRAELLASALLARRLAWWRADRLTERSEAALQAVAEARRSDNVHLELTAMLFALADLFEQGRLDEHTELLNRYRVLCTNLRQPLYDVYASFIEAGVELAVGNYATARQLADAALERGLRSHGASAVMVHAGIWFQVHHDLGTLETTIDECERHARAGNRLWNVALATALAMTGEQDRARTIFEQLIDRDALHLRDTPLLLTMNCRLIEIAAALGDAERATEIAATLEPYTDRLASSGLGGVTFGPIGRFVGLAALARGDAGEASIHLERAADVAGRLGLVPHEAGARHDLARALRARGEHADAARAEQEAARAQELAATIGLRLRP
jgi:tetratricopeptide (TPR) repeat protein